MKRSKIELGQSINQMVADDYFRSRFLWMALQFACLPLAHHKPVLEQYYKEMFEEAYKAPLPPEIIKGHLAFLKCYRTMLGRAVQPKGSLTNLAPIVGAIRLRNNCAGPASEYLAPRLTEALAKGDSEYVAKVRKFAKAPLGKHRSHQILVAIFELRNSGNFGESRMLRNAGRFRLFPNTKEIKDYISKTENLGAERFSDLPTDEATLSKLIASSGAMVFVEKAVRGAAVRR